jgi:hypothetical protein
MKKTDYPSDLFDEELGVINLYFPNPRMYRGRK